MCEVVVARVFQKRLILRAGVPTIGGIGQGGYLYWLGNADLHGGKLVRQRVVFLALLCCSGRGPLQQEVFCGGCLRASRPPFGRLAFPGMMRSADDYMFQVVFFGVVSIRGISPRKLKSGPLRL